MEDQKTSLLNSNPTVTIKEDYYDGMFHVKSDKHQLGVFHLKNEAIDFCQKHNLTFALVDAEA